MPFTIPKTKVVAISELTRDTVAAVPSLGAIDDRPTVLIYTRQTGDFSPTEQTQLTAIYTAHDATAIATAAATRLALQASERAKIPATLSIPERLHRIEVTLNLD